MIKTAKKVVLKLLVMLALTRASLCRECSDNCFKCSPDGSCYNCYKRKVVPIGPPNYGVECSSKLPPPSSHCLIYNDIRCQTCEPGWSTDYSSGAKTPCIKGTIQNCMEEYLIGGTTSCWGCYQGYPNDTGSKCITAALVTGAISFCIVGGRNDSGSPICLECQRGYTSDLGSCFKTTPALMGCLQTNGSRTKCVVCDAENGYFQREPHRCAKNGGLSAA